MTWETSSLGTGSAAARTLQVIIEGIVKLADSPSAWPIDSNKPDCRKAVIKRHVIRFRSIGDGHVFVERIFGPGRNQIR